tara:strand:- start:30146 stop:30370 length:225 start_codon:yes stop_codon:yes gene_type:complete
VKVSDYRDEMMSLLIKVDTRQEEIFHRLKAIDNHLEKLNGKVADHESSLVRIKTIGMVGIFAIPITINLIMRFV